MAKAKKFTAKDVSFVTGKCMTTVKRAAKELYSNSDGLATKENGKWAFSSAGMKAITKRLSRKAIK
jgi:hypothetical protein